MVQAEKLVSNINRRPFAIRAARRLWRLLAYSTERYSFFLRWRRSSGVFQPFNDTRANRYPRIFRFVQSELGSHSDLRILSFGCSTGEEVQSLRRYFPHAFIKGIDINPGNIAACRKWQEGKNERAVTFEIGNATTAEPSAIYDAIFCMAVLRHGGLGVPGVTRCDHILRFEKFAGMIEDFARCLKPGGLLVIRHSNFRVCDTRVAANFETVLRLSYPENGRSHIFGPDNRLIEDMTYPDTVFRKTRS